MEAHFCNEAFASRWPPPSVDLDFRRSLKGAPARNGSKRARQNPGSRASGCGEASKASYWIERVKGSASNPVPTPRASFSSAHANGREIRRGNAMPYFSHNFTCKRLPSFPGRPSRHTLCCIKQAHSSYRRNRRQMRKLAGGRMPRRYKLSSITAFLRSAAQPSPAAYHFLHRPERCRGCSVVYVLDGPERGVSIIRSLQSPLTP